MNKISLPLMILAAACASQDDTTQRKNAEEIATRYLKSKSMLDQSLRTSVDDAGESWVVTYYTPEGAAGGNQHVWVDKRTMEVVSSVGSQ